MASSGLRPSIERICFWFTAGLFFSSLLWGQNGAELTTGPVEIEDVAIVVGDEPFLGSVIFPATDDGFNFKLRDTGDKVFIRWVAMERSERQRIQRLMGVKIEDDGRLVFGKEITCTKLILKTKRSWEGLELPERALPGCRCLKTTTQLVQIQKHLVEREEKVVKRESDIFSGQEIYERILLERPPALDSAMDHINLARECGTMGLYEKGIEHLAMAEAIDPRTKDAHVEFRQGLLVKHAEQQAERLFNRIVVDLNGARFAEALDKIKLLRRNFPNSEYYTRVEPMMERVEKGAEADFARRVVFLYYLYFNDFIQNKVFDRIRVDDKGRKVPAVPGKQVTTLQGRIFRGKLISQDEENVVIQCGDMQLKIRAKEVLAIQDKDLAAYHKEIRPDFGTLKAYVMDAKGGLAREIVTRIAQETHTSEDRVWDVWNSRFNKTATYENGQLKVSPTYTTVHAADYGHGSWVRHGERNNYPVVGLSDPSNSPDPEVWWKVQPVDFQCEFLRALASEKHFRTKKLLGKECPHCWTKGYIEIWDMFGTMKQVRCPTCRGLCYLTQVLYE